MYLNTSRNKIPRPDIWVLCIFAQKCAIASGQVTGGSTTNQATVKHILPIYVRLFACDSSLSKIRLERICLTRKKSRYKLPLEAFQRQLFCLLDPNMLDSLVSCHVHKQAALSILMIPCGRRQPMRATYDKILAQSCVTKYDV